jgi:hypothetical protein
MTETSIDRQSGHLFRVDKFVVPASGRAEFLGRVAETHAVLRAQDGFVRDVILEQQSGPGEFNFVTLVEWSDAGVLDHVSAEVARMHARAGFNPMETIARLGIRADIANYRSLDI